LHIEIETVSDLLRQRGRILGFETMGFASSMRQIQNSSIGTNGRLRFGIDLQMTPPNTRLR